MNHPPLYQHHPPSSSSSFSSVGIFLPEWGVCGCCLLNNSFSLSHTHTHKHSSVHSRIDFPFRFWICLHDCFTCAGRVRSNFNEILKFPTRQLLWSATSCSNVSHFNSPLTTADEWSPGNPTWLWVSWEGGWRRETTLIQSIHHCRDQQWQKQQHRSRVYR